MTQAPPPERRALGPTELVTELSRHPGWTLQGDGDTLCIARRYSFDRYAEVMAFANAVAWQAQRRDHHPELLVGYNYCSVSWRTHDAGGITRLDFACADEVDTLKGQA